MMVSVFIGGHISRFKETAKDGLLSDGSEERVDMDGISTSTHNLGQIQREVHCVL